MTNLLGSARERQRHTILGVRPPRAGHGDQTQQKRSNIHFSKSHLITGGARGVPIESVRSLPQSWRAAYQHQKCPGTGQTALDRILFFPTRSP
jgi:hypothetical protein